MPIRVLVVDDSAFMRKVIADMLHAEATIEVVGTARDGQQALEHVAQLQPDCITMDVEMPVMDGLQALQHLVRSYSIPVIMLSSTTYDAAENTLRALEIGAFDFVTKPSGSISLDIAKVKNDLIAKVIMAYTTTKRTTTNRQKEFKQPVKRNAAKQGEPLYKRPKKAPRIRTNANRIPSSKIGRVGHETDIRHLVLVGTSTGGPKALHTLFSAMPYDPRTAFLIVQHMPPGFTASLAKRLNSISEYEVQEGRDNKEIRGGNVYVAPGGWHMQVKMQLNKLILSVNQMPPIHGHRPAVDTLFESAARVRVPNMTGVILTGMGKDGSAGLKQLRSAHHSCYVIAQDEASCVVFGMPKAAIASGLVDQVMPLDHISRAIFN